MQTKEVQGKLWSPAPDDWPQIAGELTMRKAITQSAQRCNLADDIYFMKNHFTFFIAEKA